MAEAKRPQKRVVVIGSPDAPFLTVVTKKGDRERNRSKSNSGSRKRQASRGDVRVPQLGLYALGPIQPDGTISIQKPEAKKKKKGSSQGRERRKVVILVPPDPQRRAA